MQIYDGTNFVFMYVERYNVVRVSVGVKGCSSDIHRVCSSNAAAVILTITALVLVMLLVNFPPADLCAKHDPWTGCGNHVTIYFPCRLF
jgi:hypothetical protein